MEENEKGPENPSKLWYFTPCFLWHRKSIVVVNTWVFWSIDVIYIYIILVKCMALAAHNSTCIYCKHPFAQSLLWSGHWRLHWRHIAGCTEGHVKIGRNCTRLQISSKLASCRWATMTYIGLETCSTSFGKLCLCVTTSRKTLGCMREPLQSIKSFKVSWFLARPSLSRSLDLCWANSSIW